jgi:diacylglycerol kinase
MNNWRRLINSFRYAFEGLSTVSRTEQNFRVHLFVAALVVVAGIYFHLRVWEWVVIIMFILLVFLLEMLNTVFERLVDMLKPRVHLYVRDIKNITSSMVLITAVSAVIIGILIFGQYLFR